MANIYTSGWTRAQNGGTTTYDPPDAQNFIQTEVRWRGISQPGTPRRRKYQAHHEPPEPVPVVALLDIPTLPSGAFDSQYSFEISVSAPVGVEYQMTHETPSGRATTAMRGNGDRFYSYSSFPSDNYRIYIHDAPAGTVFQVDIEVELFYQVNVTFDTDDPTVTLNGGDSAAVGHLNDNEVSAWQSISGLEEAQNIFAHSIGGSQTADFQFRYTYSDAAAVPTSVGSAPTTASIAASTMSVEQTPVASEPLASLRDFSNAGPGWMALLETDGGEEVRLESHELMGTQINTEHTAAWGGTIDVPPIIDMDRFRGGTMQLRYNGSLILRCPELVGRTRNSDGSVTIDGLGPASEFKSFPVDRTFDDVFATSAMQTLLVGDAGLSPSQFSIHDAPDDPVTDETVLSASNRREFERILLSRARNESGQFVGMGGDAPNWLASDPFAWDGEGGVQTTQTLQFREAEGFVASQSATANAVAGASGGEIVSFGDADGDTTTTYSIQFTHEIPEGEFSIGIRAKSESLTANGTTTIRLRAGDQDLVSFPADDYLTGQGFAWKHIDTGFTPGTDPFELRVDVTEAGEQRLDIDCLAVYDNRYEYTFDNETDMAGALSGPELYPDAAPLNFQSAPAGIALDSVTATATVNVEGEADTIGVEATGGRGSSSESFDGATDSHTAEFPRTTAGVRPTISLSRSSDGRTTTPTSGNAPQSLRSLDVTISGNAIPIIGYREFEATNVFDALQTLCEDYDYHWVVEHGRERGSLAIELFRRGDPKLRRPLPDRVVVMDSSESAEAQGYANSVTVIGAEIPGEESERYRWTEENMNEIDAFGREPAPHIENDDLETLNDCRAVARAELAKRLDEDERGGSLEIVPNTIVDPGYPYRVRPFEDDDAATVPGWGESWGESWGGPRHAYATLESSSFAFGSSSSLEFSTRSDVLAALAGGF